MPHPPRLHGASTAVAFPPVVFVPVMESATEPGQAQLPVHRLDDGRTAVFVYSALDRMGALYGDQPWVLLDLSALRAARLQSPWDLTALDTELVQDPAATPTQAAADAGSTPEVFMAGIGSQPRRTIDERTAR